MKHVNRPLRSCESSRNQRFRFTKYKNETHRDTGWCQYLYESFEMFPEARSSWIPHLRSSMSWSDPAWVWYCCSFCVSTPEDIKHTVTQLDWLMWPSPGVCVCVLPLVFCGGSTSSTAEARGSEVLQVTGVYRCGETVSGFQRHQNSDEPT